MTLCQYCGQPTYDQHRELCRRCLAYDREPDYQQWVLDSERAEREAMLRQDYLDSLPRAY
jgi:hypothetical protein